jgi:hypothetical protein
MLRPFGLTTFAWLGGRVRSDTAFGEAWRKEEQKHNRPAAECTDRSPDRTVKECAYETQGSKKGFPNSMISRRHAKPYRCTPAGRCTAGSMGPPEVQPRENLQNRH